MRIPARLSLLFLPAVIVATVSQAQIIHVKDGEVRPAFETVVIKPNNSGRNGQHGDYEHGRYTASNVEVKSLIKNAYGIRSDTEISGGDNAILAERIDIDAKTDDDLAKAIDKMRPAERRRTMGLMQQSLLEERFHLKVHIETKNMTVLALVVAKGGPKLTPSSGAILPPTKFHDYPLHPGDSYNDEHDLIANAAGADTSIQVLTNILSYQPEVQGRHVIDETGLTGTYDWQLHWAPQHGTPIAEQPQTEEPTLTDALHNQLGLQLKPDKANVEMIVIDKIDQFSDN
jgi:uncharacterized protein (TIGR03435 family)